MEYYALCTIYTGDEKIMCQQCIKYGLAVPVNKKGTIAQVRRESKKPEEGDDNKRGRGKK
jgi:hypothetical protein